LLRLVGRHAIYDNEERQAAGGDALHDVEWDLSA